MLADHEWVEDGTLVGHEILWRGVTPGQTEADTAGHVIPVEGVFRSQEVSMNVAGETSAAAVIDKLSRDGAGPFRLWAVTVKQIRDAGGIIVRWNDDGDESHVIIGRKDKPGARVPGGLATKLRRNGYWEDEGPPPGAGADP